MRRKKGSFDLIMERLIVEDLEKDTRLDIYLSKQLINYSRSYLQKLIDQGNVSINGKVETLKKYKVLTDDLIEVSIPEPKKLDVEPENIPLEIVYEDEDLLIVNKPQGMVVHPAPGNYSGTLVNALLFHCKNLSSINGVIRPGIVHRIDKDTSGLLMVAKNDNAHKSLAYQLKNHTINRVYMAIVHGNIKEEKGTIDAPIGRHPKDRLKMTVIDKNSKNAVTHFNVKKRYGNYTLIEARLETGRTHQIRVHMSYIHHPLVGDPLYGPQKEKFKVQGQILHAMTIGFIHPTQNIYMEFKSELPLYFTNILNILEKNK